MLYDMCLRERAKHLVSCGKKGAENHTMQLYPLKFDNIYIEKIWGGRDLSMMRHNLPAGKIGESIDISNYDGIISTVINGELAGKTLDWVVKHLGSQLLGDSIDSPELPIILRLVNPRDKLSIQVHPTDEYARKAGMKVGKTEAWYIMETFEDPFVYAGTQGCTEEEFRQSVLRGDVERHMKRYNVKRGDMLLLRSGVVHAMGHDLIVVELGQNSNVTYRLCDYGRGREVDIEAALNVVDLSILAGVSPGVKIDFDGYSRIIYFVHENFAWERLDIESEYRTCSDPARFNAYTCVEGSGIIYYGGGQKEYIRYGESILIPAHLGEYTLKGRLKLLNAYVPDIEQSKKEILQLVALG